MGLNFEYTKGQTPIDPEEKEGLLLGTITTQRELNEFEQLNIEKAFEKYLFQRKPNLEEILTEKFMLNVHKDMFNNVWSWAGEYRKTNKNIGVDNFQIGTQFHQLIDDCRYWVDHKIFDDDEICLRFKHRLVSIHLFSNGNGRHSRLIADIMRKHIFKKQIFSWGRNNIDNVNTLRSTYLNALKDADLGNLKPLLEFSDF